MENGARTKKEELGNCNMFCGYILLATEWAGIKPIPRKNA